MFTTEVRTVRLPLNGSQLVGNLDYADVFLQKARSQFEGRCYDDMKFLQILELLDFEQPIFDKSLKTTASIWITIRAKIVKITQGERILMQLTERDKVRCLRSVTDGEISTNRPSKDQFKIVKVLTAKHNPLSSEVNFNCYADSNAAPLRIVYPAKSLSTELPTAVENLYSQWQRCDVVEMVDHQGIIAGDGEIKRIAAGMQKLSAPLNIKYPEIGGKPVKDLKKAFNGSGFVYFENGEFYKCSKAPEDVASTILVDNVTALTAFVRMLKTAIDEQQFMCSIAALVVTDKAAAADIKLAIAAYRNGLRS